MCFKNTPNKFGIVTKILHLAVALGMLTQFSLMYLVKYGVLEDEDKLKYILLHKSVGACLLWLGIIFILWEKKNIKPALPPNMLWWEIPLAKWSHSFLLASAFLMPFSGLFMSLTGGRAVSVFGWYTIPAITQVPAYLPAILHTFHIGWSFALLGTIILHIGAVFKHQFIYKDNVFKRMFF